MFKCNYCSESREFNSEIAYNIHIATHNIEKAEQIININDKRNDENKTHSIDIDNNQENLNKKLEEIEMKFFGKDTEKQVEIPIITPSNIYCYDITLELIDNDKKSIKVFEEINKKIIDLINEGYDVTIKTSKIEKK